MEITQKNLNLIQLNCRGHNCGNSDHQLGPGQSGKKHQATNPPSGTRTHTFSDENRNRCFQGGDNKNQSGCFESLMTSKCRLQFPTYSRWLLQYLGEIASLNNEASNQYYTPLYCLLNLNLKTINAIIQRSYFSIRVSIIQLR